MKRIYEERSYGKELVGYEYKGYYIEIENEFDGSKTLLGVNHRWYHIVLKDGEKCCYDKLYEAKQRIEKDMEMN